MCDQELKELLCQTMKELYKEKILTDIGGNLSFRSSEDPENIFWISPSGMKKDEVSPKHLIKMNMEGKVLDESDESELSPSVEWPMHLRIYKEDEDFKFIVHSHAPLA
ncbi:MAG: class II aldolase/adducin family protein, partial [Candidatus Hodarchaeales archaeon]